MFSRGLVLALAALAAAAKGKAHKSRGKLRETIAAGRQSFAANWADQWSSDQFPMRPERILSELRNAGFVHSKKGKGGGYMLARTPVEISA